ncbi:hypothetical protein M436DRAFT_86575 [Aureobasidium namibiae CBS 147.97]|uniref:Uncharacterized protein n=1 Tax=Aureobasidium namibiae CBS 147.97 TaxID=1043004 RepID=A0A074W5W2_9PEZI
MATRCFCQFLRTNDYSGISADEWQIMKGALASHQIQSDLSHATEQPTRLTECERRILTDEVVATRARATVETDSDEPDQRLRSRGTRSVVQSEGVVRSRKRAHGLDHITHVPAQATPGDPGIAVQPGNLKVVASMGQRVSGSRKRKRNPELDTGGYRVHNTNEGFLSKPSIDVEQLLETYGGLSERSAADWLSYPKKFFQMDDIPSALGKVNRRAIDRALCIFGVAGSSEHHSKMIQVVTAYTFQQEHGRKHINEPGLKQLRQRGSKFSTLVQMFEHKSILLLMPCTSLLRLDNEALEQMKSRMELSDDFGDLKHQLNKHEVLAQSLITFVKQVLLCHVPVREQTSSDGAMEVVVNETSLTQSQEVLRNSE